MHDYLEQLEAAARATRSVGCLAGALTVRGAASYAAEFVLDMAAGRCAISAPNDVVLDGTVEYEAASSGRWARRELAPGRWSMSDFRYGLALLEDACTEAEPGDPLTGARAFRLRFDVELAGALLDGGLGARWTSSSGTVVIDFRGRVSAIRVSFADETASLEHAWVVRWFEPPISIKLPDPRTVIERADYLRELEEGRH
jgi:hypothetical protein